jgi:hypothetical protein
MGVGRIFISLSRAAAPIAFLLNDLQSCNSLIARDILPIGQERAN